MGRQQRCVRLAASAGSADPSGSGQGPEVTLFEDGTDADSNLGAACIWAAQNGRIAAAYQRDDWWITVVPEGTSGRVSFGGAHSTQLLED